MRLLNSIRRLNEPFPEKKSFKENTANAAWIGAFIAFFLFYFKPFGIENVSGQVHWVALIFGTITFGVTVLVDAVTRFIFKFKRDTDQWTLGKWIIDTSILIFFIAVANYLFFLYLANAKVSLEGFLGMFVSTYGLGLFPIVISGLMIQMKAAKKNQSEALQIQNNLLPVIQPENDVLLRLRGQNVGELLEMDPSCFLFAESLSNYVSVCYLDQLGAVKNARLRNTIQAIVDQIKDPLIMRCHRSYIVNAHHILQVDGNAQGLRITLNSLEQSPIPVSRSYVKAIRSMLSS